MGKEQHDKLKNDVAAKQAEKKKRLKMFFWGLAALFVLFAIANAI